jgi:cytochrome c-type biogenesis protein CcmH
MTLWFLFAVMTAAAIFAVLWPLGRSGAARRSGSDLAVYRDQIAELDRDRDAGLIAGVEAEAARVELSRRLLAAAEQSQSGVMPSPGGTLRRRVAAVVVLAGVPAVAMGLYLSLGSPDLPGQPIAGRVAAPVQNRGLDALVAQVEAHLAKNPEDGRGWEVVAPVYMRFGRFEDAVKARRNAIRLNGASGDREADLGESLMALANGVVTDEAKAAFERALALDAKLPKARFFLGVAAHQDGQGGKAVSIWRAMLSEAPPDSPWSGMVRETLARVEGGTPPAEQPAASTPAPGPTADDVAAADKMSPQDRSAMVRQMVERLAERLARDGSDVDGWLRLVRAYTVMGDRGKAISAVADARKAIGHDADKLRRLDDLVKELKLEG